MKILKLTKLALVASVATVILTTSFIAGASQVEVDPHAHIQFLGEKASVPAEKSGLFGDISKDYKGYLIGLLNEIDGFLRLHHGHQYCAQALGMKANIQGKLGLRAQQLSSLIKLSYEYPASAPARDARAIISSLIREHFEDYARYLGEIPLQSGGKDLSERHFDLLKIYQSLPYMEALFSVIVDEHLNFLKAYPAHSKADQVQEWLATHYRRHGWVGASVMVLEQMVNVYPSSSRKAFAQIALADILRVEKGQVQEAETAYQKVVETYPESEAARLARFGLAKLYEQDQDDFQKAFEEYKAIMQSYQDAPTVIKALQNIARINHEYLEDYNGEINAYLQIADKYPGEQAVKALLAGAQTASRNMGDYLLHISLNERVEREYAKHILAAQAIFSNAEVFENNLLDKVSAMMAYQKVIDSYPMSEYVHLARERVIDLRGY